MSTVACSKSKSASPVAPSSEATGASAPGSPVAAGATISGTVVTGRAPAAAPFLGGNAPQALTALASAGRVTVSVNGTSISVTSDDNGNFVLQNVTPGTPTLTISGSGFSVQVTLPAVSSNEQVRVTVRVSGSTASLDDQEVESPDKVEIEGVIGSASGLSSSGGTIVVGRLNTAVLVTASTSITKGGTTLKPNDLTVGTRVHVRATKSASTLTATVIIVQNETPGSSNGKSDDRGKDEDDDENESEVTGVIADTPAGGCPASNRFTVGTTRVVTNGSTKFDNTSCANLAKGDTVSVEGAKQADGSILAKEVEKKNGGGSSGSGSSGDGSSGKKKKD
jgi:hypothetical protein